MTFEEIFKSSYTLTEKETEEMFKKTIGYYQKALEDIDSQIKDVYAKILAGVDPTDYFNQMTKYNRLVQLQKYIVKTYLSYLDKVDLNQFEISKQAIKGAYYRQMFAMEWVKPDDISTVEVVLNPKIIEMSVYGNPKVWNELKVETQREIDRTFGSAKAYLPKHGTLIETLTKSKTASIAKLQNTITQGLIEGLSYTRMAAKIKDDLNTSANNAQRIARTEAHRNMSTGNYAMTENLKSNGIEVKRKIVSTLDDRTRPQSQQVDGIVEGEDGYFNYPDGLKVLIPGNSGISKWDINDRESIALIVDGVSPTMRRARNPVTGKTEIINWENYDEWVKKYDKSL